jgi:uncharacterized circularly permuted ATP-grasp superfamily protein/uncharacterized alpha-E superfamily protein
MVDGRGGLRPQWRGILGALTSLGDGLAERGRRLDLAFEEEGVTSVLPGASATDQSWRCDPVPLPLAAAEFSELEAGLAQRARLLEAILQDLYGPQNLLADGALPPALVHANPGFLRMAAGTAVPPLLQSYAADLIRGPDGTWRVLADRTAAPSGVGYARENRRLLNRVVPEIFRPVQVRQLRPFFDIWQEALLNLAPPGKVNPAVALLTPGTDHPQWFEHMALSRELSCALVEAGDLTVRGGDVFLKTLKGLLPVDVLVRRVEGRAIDPLELDPSSAVGVTGLLDAVRAGKLRITNDPGTGLAEAPALAAFLPALCMRLLDERLLLASVPTMWLGQDRARGLVEQEAAEWLIRPALDGAIPAIVPSTLEPSARAELMARIAARPWAWAATASIPPSMAPCAGPHGLVPKPIVLRVFMVFDGRAWHAMQGGLARVVEERERLAGRLPRTGMSKDVWVMSEDRADILGPAAHPTPPLRIRRTSGDLPSRVADDMFWLGRYVERLDRAACLIRAAVTRLARAGALLPREASELSTLAHCLVAAGFVPAEAAATATTTTLVRELLASVREGGKVDLLFDRVSRLTEGVRDRLTGDMYATFTQTLRGARGVTIATGDSLDALSHGMISVLRFAATVSGVAAENMVRGGGFLFLDLGRRVERAQSVAAEVAAALDQPPARTEVGLRLILELCDSAITYRSRYLNVLQPAPVLDLVLVDRGNPRGLAFQLLAMHTLLEELAEGTAVREKPTGPPPPREMLAAVAAGLVAEAEILVEDVLAASDQSAAAAALPARLHAIGGGVAALSDRISRRYFALLPAVQTVGWTSEITDPRGVV